MKKIFFTFLILLFTIYPFLSFAEIDDDFTCADSDNTTLCDIINETGTIVTDVIILLMIVATIVVIWGVIRYILAGSSEQRKKEGKDLIIWGLIGLFVLVAVWGLVAILENTFGIEEENIPRLPGHIDF